MTKQPIPTSEEISAGGLVVSKSDPTKVALICHRNRGGGRDWCLPKGHLEDGESLEQTAIREIGEETGLTGEIIAKLGEINYSFKAEGKRIKKTVHHYLLKEVDGALSAEGDPTGEVLEVRWFDLEE